MDFSISFNLFECCLSTMLRKEAICVPSAVSYSFNLNRLSQKCVCLVNILSYQVSIGPVTCCLNIQCKYFKQSCRWCRFLLNLESRYISRTFNFGNTHCFIKSCHILVQSCSLLAFVSCQTIALLYILFVYLWFASLLDLDDSKERKQNRRHTKCSSYKITENHKFSDGERNRGISS